ncbi:MAG: nitrate reductase molybdenum cofactor assembly chaperone [Gammaproteobacteria bacterium]
MRLYKILSLLLDYPTPELKAHWREIETLVSELDGASDADRAQTLDFMHWADALPFTEFQAVYVKTFDLTPDNALYLTHHLFEEQDRDRGPALVDLSEYLAAQGFGILNGELPDYLPLLLEYVSTLASMTEARLFLQQSSHAAQIVADNLDKIQSPYAPLLRIVERHGRLVEIAA